MPSSPFVVNLGFAGEMVALAVLSMPMLAICNGTVEPNFSYTPSHFDLFKNAPDRSSCGRSDGDIKDVGQTIAWSRRGAVPLAQWYHITINLQLQVSMGNLPMYLTERNVWITLILYYPLMAVLSWLFP
jgi:hypothetical protein